MLLWIASSEQYNIHLTNSSKNNSSCVSLGWKIDFDALIISHINILAGFEIIGDAISKRDLSIQQIKNNAKEPSMEKEKPITKSVKLKFKQRILEKKRLTTNVEKKVVGFECQDIVEYGNSTPPKKKKKGISKEEVIHNVIDVTAPKTLATSELNKSNFLQESSGKLQKYENCYPLGIKTTPNTAVGKCVLPPPQCNCRPFNASYCEKLVHSFLTSPKLVSTPVDLIPFRKNEDGSVELLEVKVLDDVHKVGVQFYIVDGQHTIEAAKKGLGILRNNKGKIENVDKLRKYYETRISRILSHSISVVDCEAISRALNEVSEKYHLKSSYMELLYQARMQWESLGRPKRHKKGGQAPEKWKNFKSMLINVVRKNDPKEVYIGSS
ncbi:hypothetical protein O6H91_18G045200 [Diphasiastrum complanatum]|uniref:Uncharacterized protein n=1 Tax=Diphasiastrum complanatum TaxID=34168 RepID=A0ACC2B0M5_DIPCM|nr:hypothetical protein O6H91_18G045200 [Diphasiastrum complanatum]